MNNDHTLRKYQLPPELEYFTAVRETRVSRHYRDPLKPLQYHHDGMETRGSRGFPIIGTSHHTFLANHS